MKLVRVAAANQLADILHKTLRLPAMAGVRCRHLYQEDSFNHFKGLCPQEGGSYRQGYQVEQRRLLKEGYVADLGSQLT
jgi:hypothetical protein